MLETGTTAPDVELQHPDAHSTTLKQLVSEGPVVLAFFKAGCPVCQFTFPFLERLHQGTSPEAPRLFGVSQDDADSTRQFNERFGVTFPALLDPKENRYPASNGFQITNVPSLFLVERDGRISWALNGFSKAELERLGERFGVQTFLEGEKVPALRPG